MKHLPPILEHEASRAPKQIEPVADCRSWGLYPRAAQRAVVLRTRHDARPHAEASSFLPFGLGRSYGDVCLNDGGSLLLTRGLDRFIAFDSEHGLLRCEAGVSLGEILEFATPRGWFLPVSPGTKYVTVGGAVANDVHGKNHHRAGTFGGYVRSLTLRRSDGSLTVCSPSQNAALFSATVGGLGLTGLIVELELALKRVPSPAIRMDSIKFHGLAEFEALSRDSDREFEYTVAWLDCVSTDRNFARGIFMRGNHAPAGTTISEPWTRGLGLTVPTYLPEFVLNRCSVSAFNFLYYHKQFRPVTAAVVHHDPFFYPLDAVQGWNRIYGRRGLLQFQCVVPRNAGREAVKEILQRVVREGSGSFLAVLKEFGDLSSPGMLSFPRSGTTLCLDFPMRGERTLRFFRELDNVVHSVGGALYPAKDATMAGEHFRSYFPRWKEFSQYIDPRYSSSFWRRVMGEGHL